MRAVETDGRICLDRNLLKQLRRRLGVSQEKVAFLCAEKGLCVSIASIKRAETSKNILYRTARDIATVYNVDVDSLISTQEAPPSAIIQSPESSRQQQSVSGLSSQCIPFKQKLILLSYKYLADSVHTSLPSEAFLSAIKPELEYFDASILSVATEEIIFTFGLNSSTGKPALKALHCAQALSRHGNGNAHSSLCQLSITDILSSTTERDIKHENPCGEMQDQIKSHKEIFGVSVESGIFVSNSLKDALDDSFEFIAKDNKKCWKLKSGRAPKLSATPMVGRNLELLQFKSVIESTQEYQTTQLIILQASAGTGKTRLLSEYCELSTAYGYQHYTFNIFDFASEQHQKTLLTLATQLIEFTFCSLDPIDLIPLLLENNIYESEDLVHVYSWLGWPLPTELLCVLENSGQDQLEKRQSSLLAKVIRLASKKQALLLAIEDLHWADEDLLRILTATIQQLDDEPVVFVLSARPEPNIKNILGANAWQIPCLHIQLSSLSNTDALTLAREFSPKTDEQINICIHRSEGNPLFLTQLLRQDSAQTSEVPYSIYELIQSQVSELDENNQRVLFFAAVMGKNFNFCSVCELAKVTNYYPNEFIERGIWVANRETYTFAHALIQEAVYQAISESARQELHWQFADWYGDKHCVEHAYHMLHAKHKESHNFIYNAVCHLVSQCRFDSAQNFVNDALNIHHQNFDKSRFYLKEGEILVKTGNIQHSLSCFERASVSPNTTIATQALIEQANSLNTLDRFDDAIQVLSRAETIANDGGDHELLARIYSLRGNFHFPRGDTEQCFNLHQIALSHAQACENNELQAKALGGLGDATYAQGKIKSAESFLDQCLHLCSSDSYLTVQAANLYMRATVKIYLNKTQSALEDALRAAALSQRIGHKRAEIVSRLTASWIYVDKLDHHQAKTQIQRGLTLAEEIGAKRFEPFLLEALARMYYWMGDLPEAQSVAKRASIMVHQLGIESFIGPWVLSTQALCSSDENAAKQLLSNGFEILQKGCIGHNHFHYYVNAIEVSLRYKDIESVNFYCQQLLKFTENEPTPWSDFYIKRAHCLTRKISGLCDTIEEHTMIREAESAELNSALIAIKSKEQIDHA